MRRLLVWTPCLALLVGTVVASSVRADEGAARALAARIDEHVDLIDDFGPHNKPSHPELLDELGRAFAASGCDEKFLIRAICLTAAYQRTSRASDAGQEDARLFARMNAKGLSAEQLFDSLALATGYRDTVPLAARPACGWAVDSPRGQFMAQFPGGSRRTDQQASILQALALMNGGWLARQTAPSSARRCRPWPRRFSTTPAGWRRFTWRGFSQIDTFDPKPGRPTGGSFKAIETAVPGIRIAEHLPRIAGQMKQLALLRSMKSKEGNHSRAAYLLRTGNLPQEPIQYPTLGSLLSKELGDSSVDPLKQNTSNIGRPIRLVSKSAKPIAEVLS